MLKRTLLFASPCHLSLKHSQLCFKPREENAEERTVPIEDVAIVVIESLQITLSVQLLQKLSDNGVAVVFCDQSHMPQSLLLPMEGHTTHAETLRHQIDAKLPLKKNLWKQIVQAKIKNQAALLVENDRPQQQKLQLMAKAVKSGDHDNREGVAAKIYWQAIFDTEGFTRDRDGLAPNNLLNYGYSVLRAATARSLVSSGFHCAIGLHHSNRYNAFSLVDDIMEPYRPFVDRIVFSLHNELENLTLTPTIKARLLEVLTTDTQFGDERRPLMISLSLTTASLSKCLRGNAETIAYPLL